MGPERKLYQKVKKAFGSFSLAEALGPCSRETYLHVQWETNLGA
jgi:hypothetical protein